MIDAFQEKVYQKTNGEYQFLQPFNGKCSKILCRHNLCNNIFKISPYYFKKVKKPCPYCRNIHYKFRTDDNGNIDHLITIRCPKMHRYKIYQHQLKDYKNGKIKCPICKKLKILDPLYRHSKAEFDYTVRGGQLL